MAVYQTYNDEGYVGYFTTFSDAKEVHDSFNSKYQARDISLCRLDEKSGELMVENWWSEKRKTYLREITKGEIEKLPDEIFSYQGSEWATVSAFIDEESMLKYLVQRYGDNLSHIKPTRENFAIHTLSWFRNSPTFEYAVISAMDSGERIMKTKINTITREWKSPGEEYIPLMNEEKLHNEFEKIRE
uniref:Uncharacterized protein n=1 Tax=Pithovirus LCPAC406 TaxID=2506599 RepID=A0A481ZG37_9VIRU|nr:MAG: hypothetical protein LCPAC406_00630 [Pithovirus LCPAC406]